MKKLLFGSIIFAILIVSASAAYYFFSFLPKVQADQLALEKQKFEYQKEKDAQAQQEQKAKQLQSTIQFDSKMQQENYNNAKARCEQESDANYQKFENLISQCQTPDCPTKIAAIPGVLTFGGGWIQKCIQQEISL